MTIWIAIAVLLGLSMFVLLRSLRARKTGEESGADAAFYRAQLAEIERQTALGQIDAGEAQAARVEASRRLIAASASESVVAPASQRHRRAAAIVVLLLLPAIALPLYLRLGAPQLPAEPLSARLTVDPARMDINMAVARIERHLAEHPEDGRGHAVLAPVYMRLGRYDDAVRAWRSALRLLPETAAMQADLGEALTAAQDGVVSADARSAFQRALALDPSSAKARFFLARAAEQDGDKTRALAMLKDLRAQAREPALQRVVDGEIARLGGAPPAAAVPKGGEAIAALPDAERQSMIRGMVQGLDARLKAQGGSADEWARLVRAYTVLGQPAEAGDAAARARKALAEKPADLTSFEQSVAGLDLPAATKATP